MQKQLPMTRQLLQKLLPRLLKRTNLRGRQRLCQDKRVKPDASPAFLLGEAPWRLGRATGIDYNPSV